jgi:mRNA interferase RelE/StbE
MAYKTIPTAAFEKSLRKIGREQAKRVLRWIKANLEDTDDPRTKGKRLQHQLKPYWRYRIGDYRLIVEIIDNQLILQLIKVAHRKDVYKQKI